MDSNSNSSEMCWPKIEMDAESERETKRDPRINWSSENTMKLIDSLEKECKELWDMKHPMYRDRVARQMKHDYLADMFSTTAEEISRKIHNLRTQLNNELRKIKRRAVTSGSGEAAGSAGGSGWEYFDALSFLLRVPLTETLDGMEGVNLALAEFQADEEEEFGIAARANLLASSSLANSPTAGTALDSTGSPPRTRRMRVAASAPPPLPISAHHLMWQEDAVPRLRPGMNTDECQIFGDFVASELRTLRSDDARKKLKRIVQKAILKIGEEEDIHNMGG